MTKQAKKKKGPKFNIRVQLTGGDGNAFVLMGKVRAAIRKGGATKDQIDEFTKEATSGDYDHLLNVCMDWVHVR